MVWFEQEYFVDHLAYAQARALGERDDGFLKWKPARLAPPSAPITVLSPRPAQEEQLVAEQEAPVLVPAQGVYKLHDCILRVNGEISHGGSIVREHQALGSVAFDWASRCDKLPDRRTRIINAPGISILGPGYKVYGHLLADFIPKLIVALNTLGPELGGGVVPLPKDTPKWVIDMVNELCPEFKRRWVTFDGQSEQLQFANLFVPTFAHASYAFHPWLAGFLAEYSMQLGHKKIYVSRRHFESRYGVVKHFSNEEDFENEAVRRGFEVVSPENLDFIEQVRLFGSARAVVGEYGSALHAMMFAPFGAVCGMIRCPNDIQLRIGALRRQPSVVLLPEIDMDNEDGSVSYTASRAEMLALFDAVDSML